jgi:tight adherence protein C
MPVGIWLAALAVAVSLPIAWWGFSGARAEGRTARANLASSLGAMATDLREAALAAPASDRVVAPVVAGLARRARRFTPVGALERIERRAFLAGLTDTWPSDRLLATKATGAIVMGIAGVLAFVAQPGLTTLVLLGVLVAIGWFATDYALDMKARERQGAIERQLPDVLDQITVCVEAGLGFEAAMARIAQNDGPLPAEIGRTLQDIQIGVPRDQALENLLERTDVSDLRAFVHAFVQAERYGIPIAQVLRVQAAEMRDKRKMRAEERAMKMPVKIVFPVVLCILPALFVVVAGPAVVRLSQTSFGG